MANSEKIVLFEKKEERFIQLAELEKGSAGILTLDSLNLIFEQLEEKALVIPQDKFNNYEIIDNSLKFILSQKIVTEAQTFILIIFTSKKSGF